MSDNTQKSVLLYTAENFYSAWTAPSTCIEWQGRRQQDGYGSLTWEGKPARAHRVAWELANGPIPDGMQVLHHCDNRGCVNVEHLYLGDHRQNMADKVARPKKWGWGAKGESSGKHKVTTEQVLEIRRRYAAGESGKAITASGDFPLSYSAIHDIISRKTWPHV